MSKAEAARRYLQADMARNYTGLPARAKRIHTETMNKLQREHGDELPLHAAVGTTQDFDAPLGAGEREHQKHMQSQLADHTPKAIAAHRQRIRAPKDTRPTRPRPKPTRRAAARAGAHAGRSYYRSRSARQTGLPAAAGATGSIVMEAIGVGLALTIAYLLLSGKGSKGLTLFFGGLTKGLEVLIQPIDPLNVPARSQTAPGKVKEGGAGGEVPASPRQRARLNPKFGPAPGIGTVITPIGGQG